MMPFTIGQQRACRPVTTRREVGPGTKIFIPGAQKQADGGLKTQRITYGKDGLTPPM